MGVFSRASLRTRLVWLVAGALLPVAVLAIAGLVVLGQRQYAQAQQALVERARALSNGVDREFLASAAALEVLALSDKLDSGDFRRFHAEARAAAAKRAEWHAIILVDPAGNRLLNTLVPYGAPLRGGAPVIEKESFDAVVARRGPAVGDATRGPGGRVMYPLRVPVVRGGELRYVLTAITRPEAMLRMLERQQVPADSVATIFDGQGSIVARSRNHAQYVATPVPDALRRLMAMAREGSGVTTTREGEEVHAAFSRSAQSAWGVALGVPKATLDAPIWRSYALYGTGIVLSLVLGLFTAARLARRIALPIAELGAAAHAVGRGEVPPVPPPSIPEVDVVAGALNAAATELRESRERTLLAMRLYALLSHTNQCVVRERDRARLLQEICRGTVELGGFAAAWIGWIGDDGEVSGVAARAGADEAFVANALQAAREQPDVRERFAQIVAEAKPVVRDLERFPVAGQRGEELLRLGYRSVAGLQIRNGGRVCAMLMVYSKRAEHFEAPELRLLDEIAIDIGFAFEMGELEEQRRAAEAMTHALNASLTRQAERLRILHEVDRALIAAETPEAIARGVLQPLRELLGVARVVVNLIDLEAGEVEWLAAAGRRRIHVGPGVRFSTYLIGDLEALKRGESQLIDVASLPAGPEVDALLASGVHVYMAVPMIVGGELIGALSFGGDSAAFPKDQVTVAREVANQFAIVITQARLHERVKRQAEELERRVAARTAQLQAANKELEAFSYSVSHDLRAPLRAIDGYTQMIEEDYAGRLDQEGRRRLGIVRSETQRMGRLIDDLLAFSRLGREALSYGNVDMAALARRAAEELLASTPQSRPELELAPLPEAWGDATLLYQVWANLLGNAIKFSGRRERPRIEVSGRLDGASAVYCVKDNGAGFDMQYYDKLFGAFQRLHSEAEFDGTGIGLATVKRILEQQRGSIWAESRPDAGATFWFSLPTGTAEG